MQDDFEPPTLEELDNDLGDLAGYIEGQQILLDFMFDMFAGNLASLAQDRLRQVLLTKTLPRVRTDISIAVLAYSMKRMIKIMGMQCMVRASAA